MTTKFDPKQHILVVRDATTGRHVHVAWDDVLNQLAEAPAQPIRVDLAPIMARIDAIERRPESPLVADAGLSYAVGEAAATLANLGTRLNKLEADYQRHEHHYQLSESQLQVIASAVLEQMRLAGVKAA